MTLVMWMLFWTMAGLLCSMSAAMTVQLLACRHNVAHDTQNIQPILASNKDANEHL